MTGRLPERGEERVVVGGALLHPEEVIGALASFLDVNTSAQSTYHQASEVLADLYNAPWHGHGEGPNPTDLRHQLAAAYGHMLVGRFEGEAPPAPAPELPPVQPESTGGGSNG